MAKSEEIANGKKSTECKTSVETDYNSKRKVQLSVNLTLKPDIESESPQTMAPVVI